MGSRVAAGVRMKSLKKAMWLTQRRDPEDVTEYDTFPH